MKIYNYYPTEYDLNELSPSDKQIAKAYDYILEHRSFKDIRLSLPITIFFNCIQTMYYRQRFEEPRLVINHFWDELKIMGSRRPYYSMDDPNIQVMNYYPRRVFERTILFGGLYAKIKAEPFGDADYMLDAISSKVCGDYHQEKYFRDFVDVVFYHKDETLSCESKQLLEALMKYKERVKSLYGSPYDDYSGSELGNNDNKPNKYDDYEEYNQRFVAGRSKKVTEAKPETQKEESLKQTIDNVSFTFSEFCQKALEQYKPNLGFVKNLEAIFLPLLLEKVDMKGKEYSSFKSKMELLEQRLGEKPAVSDNKNSAPSVSIEHNFAPITNNSDGGKSYNMGGGNEEDIRKLIDGKRRR